MRSFAVALAAMVASGVFAGCIFQGGCTEISASWMEPGIFAAVGSDGIEQNSAGPGLPASESWIQDRWPGASIESISWLPTALGDQYQEPGNGPGFRPEPLIQLFASRETYGPRPGWPHSYPYGPSIEIPPDPFLVVVVTAPGTPADLNDEIIAFLDRLDVPSETHQGILSHLEAHKEKHTGVRNPSTGEETWKNGHWAPIPKLSPLDSFLDSLDPDPRIGSRFVGWTDVDFDPQTRVTLDQPLVRLSLASSVGIVGLEIDGGDFVHATPPQRYLGDEQAIRRILENAFEKGDLPNAHVGQARVDQRDEC